MQQFKAFCAVTREHMAIAGCQDDRQVRVATADLTCEVDPIHPRHHNVGENDVKAFGIILQFNKSRFRPHHQNRSIAKLFKRLPSSNFRVCCPLQGPIAVVAPAFRRTLKHLRLWAVMG